MSEAVRCNICGLMYNSSYVSAHKRRAHPEKFKKENSTLNEADAMLRMVSLFRQLSPEGQKDLLNRLLESAKKMA